MSVEGLPNRFPIFPLAGAVLLPGGNLPLNIFEPRYLAMTRDALRTEKIIGMVQPQPEPSRRSPPPVYRTGCAGRITNFNETEDGRLLISLHGVCRFAVERELVVDTPYRQVLAEFDPYLSDLEPPAPPASLRPALVDAVRRYFDIHQISADWRAIEAAPLAGLVTSLAMICPFEASEKQALLEAPDPEARARVLTALFEMGASTPPSAPQGLRH